MFAGTASERFFPSAGRFLRATFAEIRTAILRKKQHTSAEGQDMTWIDRPEIRIARREGRLTAELRGGEMFRYDPHEITSTTRT